MGDIGLIAALLILFYALLAMTVIPMILGKYLIRKTKRKKFGAFFKIVGYVFLVPTVICGVVLILIFVE